MSESKSLEQSSQSISTHVSTSAEQSRVGDMAKKEQDLAATKPALQSALHGLNPLVTPNSCYSCSLLCPVRISFAYIFRIRLGDHYLLLGSKDGQSPFKPIGGGYRFYPETLDAIQTRFGYYPASGKGNHGHTWTMPVSALQSTSEGMIAVGYGKSVAGSGCAHVDSTADTVCTEPVTAGRALDPESYDYRLLIESAQLADFVRCFTLGEGYTKADATCFGSPDLACEYAQLQALSYALQYSGALPRVRPDGLRARQKTQESQWTQESPSWQQAEEAGAGAVNDGTGLGRDKWRRENVLDLRRELQEELVESGIFAAALGPEAGAAALDAFAQLQYRYIGRYYDGIADLRFSCGALMLTDIVELVPTTEQLKALEALSTAWGKHEPLQGLYAWVAAKDFRGHLVPRGSQRPSSMDELLGDNPPSSPSSATATTDTEKSSELRLADHCALLLTPYTVIPPSVQQCLHELAKHAAPVAHAEHTEYDVNTDLIITPRGWLVTH